MKVASLALALLTMVSCAWEAHLDVDKFITQSVTGLGSQTEAHSATWHLGEEEEWFVEQEAGLIRFTFADGTVAEGVVQIIGTFNPEDSTFLWAWDHSSVQEPLREHAKLAREFGVEHQLSGYTNRKVTCTEEDAWEFTAVAARLAEANGAYRGDAGGPWVYMTFGEINLSKQE
nr:putative integron gene cassette protein [uncultured bacterium]